MIDRKKAVCQSYLKFGAVRLCEGKSLMLTPSDSVYIDMDDAEKRFSLISRMENEFVKIDWNGVPVTIYSTGSMLFYHLNDRDIAESYAINILIELELVDRSCSEKVIKVGIENVE